MNSNSNDGLKPMPCDVLLGRGRSNSHHAGNKHYQALIRKYHREYFTLRSQREKNILSSKIVEEIKSNKGRFMKKDEKGEWKIVPHETARIKVAHSLQYYERLRRKDEPDHQPPVAWNAKRSGTSTNYSRLQSNGTHAAVPTQNAAASILQLLGNNQIIINQQAQLMHRSGNAETQQVQLDYEFLGKPLIAHVRTLGANPSGVSPAKFSNATNNTSSANEKEGKIKSKISLKGTREKTGEKGSLSTANDANQFAQTVKPAFASTTQPILAKDFLNSEFSQVTLRLFPGMQSQHLDGPLSQAASAADTAAEAIKSQSQTKNDFPAQDECVFDDNPQRRPSTNLESKINADSLRANNPAELIMRTPGNCTTAKYSNEELSPEVYESSSDISTKEVYPDQIDVYDYEYENPLLAKKQEKSATKSIGEYFVAKQLVELAQGIGIPQNEALLSHPEMGTLSYSTAQLLSVTARKRQSSSSAWPESPNDEDKHREVTCDSGASPRLQEVAQNGDNFKDQHRKYQLKSHNNIILPPIEQEAQSRETINDILAGEKCDSALFDSVKCQTFKSPTFSSTPTMQSGVKAVQSSQYLRLHNTGIEKSQI